VKSCAKTYTAGDETVSVDDLLIHAEVAAAVADQLVEFLEGAFVQQQFDALAGGELALLVLALASSLTPTRFRHGVTAPDLFQPIDGHIGRT
jgi:hypothetical protein